MPATDVPDLCPECRLLLRVSVTKPPWPHMFAYLHLTCDGCGFEHVEPIAGGI